MSSNTYHSCAVRECKNTSRKTPGKLWIIVPSNDTEMRKIWLNLAGRDPNYKSPLYFCEDHFDLENDMENYMQYKIMGSVRTIRMKPKCVPSKFVCQVNPKPKSSKPRRTYVKKKRMSNNQDSPDIRNVANKADGVQVFPVQDHKAVQIIVEEVARNAEIYQEPPEKRHKPFENSSQTESSNEDTDDNVERVTQPSIIQQIKIEPKTEEWIVKEEPVEHYEIKIEPETEEQIVKKEPVEYYDSNADTDNNEKEVVTQPCVLQQIKIEPENEEPIVKEEPVEYFNKRTPIDPLSIEVKVEPTNDKMNEVAGGMKGPVFQYAVATPELFGPIDQVITAYNHTMTGQPVEPKYLTVLPLPTRSNVLTEAQDAAASTSAKPIAEPPTITAPKSKAQKQREYRQRIAASRTSAQAIAERKLAAERQRNCRLRKAVCLVGGSLESSAASLSRSAASKTPEQAIAEKKSAAERQRNCRLRKAVCLVSSSLEPAIASSSGSIDVQTGTQHHQTLATEPAQITLQPGSSSEQIEVQRAQSNWNTKWLSSIMRFKSTFLDNDFGHACSVCDRLWFKNDLKPITAAQLEVISEWFIKENRQLCKEEYEIVCNTCKRTLNRKSMPPLAKVNGFSYPEQPPGLPLLDPISERLISPRLPFMQVRRLRHDFSYGIIGQVINVPVDEQEMVKCLPRQLNEDDVINVNITRNLAHISDYISGYMSKSTISAWLTVLQESPLYRLYDINVDLSRLHPTVPILDDIQDDMSKRIENITAEITPESEILDSRQHTMMWNEKDCLNIALQATPLDTIEDRHAEELSFPSIYFGEPRRINKGVPVTPHMIANSEIRRRDRRGATPQKILYVAMKLLRLRMVNGIQSTFRNFSVTENVTRRMLEDTEFLKEYGIQNLAFMKTVPNSIQYWASRKRDLCNDSSIW